MSDMGNLQDTPDPDRSQGTTSVNTPPTEVFIEGLGHVDTLDNETMASSSMPSHQTDRLAALFPQNRNRFGAFNPESKVLPFLTNVLKLD